MDIRPRHLLLEGMAMTVAELEAEIRKLPEEQQEVIAHRILERLPLDPAGRTETEQGPNPPTGAQFLSSPLFGLWKDRKDIGDSLAFARQLRESVQNR
jgi:hypothetical protein